MSVGMSAVSVRCVMSLGDADHGDDGRWSVPRGHPEVSVGANKG